MITNASLTQSIGEEAGKQLFIFYYVKFATGDFTV